MTRRSVTAAKERQGTRADLKLPSESDEGSDYCRQGTDGSRRKGCRICTPSKNSDEQLAQIVALLAELVELAPRIAYSTRQAGKAFGNQSESQIRRLVRDGVLAKVPHTGSRVVIAHHELVRAASVRSERIVKAVAS